MSPLSTTEARPTADDLYRLLEVEVARPNHEWTRLHLLAERGTPAELETALLAAAAPLGTVDRLDSEGKSALYIATGRLQRIERVCVGVGVCVCVCVGGWVCARAPGAGHWPTEVK